MFPAADGTSDTGCSTAQVTADTCAATPYLTTTPIMTTTTTQFGQLTTTTPVTTKAVTSYCYCMTALCNSAIPTTKASIITALVSALIAKMVY